MSLPGHLPSHIQFLKNPIFDRITPLTHRITPNSRGEKMPVSVFTSRNRIPLTACLKKAQPPALFIQKKIQVQLRNKQFLIFAYFRPQKPFSAVKFLLENKHEGGRRCCGGRYYGFLARILQQLSSYGNIKYIIQTFQNNSPWVMMTWTSRKKLR